MRANTTLTSRHPTLQRALEHYSNIDDLKRVMSRTELIQPEFLVKFFGTQSVETSMECLHHLLRTNMRQNLQVVVQVGREYSEQLSPEKLIEMFEQYNSWEGLFYYLGAVLLKTEDKDVHFKYMKLLLMYMYRGEVSCPQEDLHGLLKTARDGAWRSGRVRNAALSLGVSPKISPPGIHDSSTDDSCAILWGI